MMKQLSYLTIVIVQLAIFGCTANEKKEIVEETKIETQKNDTLKIQQDSFKNKIIGRWKLTSSKYPIKLINHDEYFNKFTVHIKSNEIADFYIEDKTDSPVTYSYSTDTDGIYLNRGCMVTKSWVSIDSFGQLKLVFDNSADDTLLLQKISIK